MAKKFALIFGWGFAVLGILGFIDNPLVGNGPGALFRSDTAHNLVHLVFGGVLLWAAYRREDKSSLILKITGSVYLLIAITGFMALEKLNNLMLVNGADNWLHLVLALGLLWAGVSKPSRPEHTSGGGMPMGTM